MRGFSGQETASSAPYIRRKLILTFSRPLWHRNPQKHPFYGTGDEIDSSNTPVHLNLVSRFVIKAAQSFSPHRDLVPCTSWELKSYKFELLQFFEYLEDRSLGHPSSIKVIKVRLKVIGRRSRSSNFEHRTANKQLLSSRSKSHWESNRKSTQGFELLTTFEQDKNKSTNSASVRAHLYITSTPHHGKRYFYRPGKLYNLWFTRCGKFGRTRTALLAIWRASWGVQNKEVKFAVSVRPKPHIGAQCGARSSLMEECRTRVVAGSEEEEEQEHPNLTEIWTPTTELQRGVRSHHWMKSRVLQHHRIHQKMSIRILHFRSQQTTSMLTPIFGLYQTSHCCSACRREACEQQGRWC